MEELNKTGGASKKKRLSEPARQMLKIWNDLHDPIKAERRRMVERRNKFQENIKLDVGL